MVARDSRRFTGCLDKALLVSRRVAELDFPVRTEISSDPSEEATGNGERQSHSMNRQACLSSPSRA